MGNFEDHVEYGVTAFLFTASLLFVFAYINNWSYELLIAMLPIAFGLTLLGSILPDIDHHNSRPFQMLRLILPTSIGIAVLVSIAFQLETVQQLTVVLMGRSVETVVIGIGAFGIASTASVLTHRAIGHFRPPHRGITHTHLFNAIVFLVTSIVGVLLVQPLSFELAETIVIGVAFGSAVSIGVLAHLRCDGIV